MNGLVRMGDLDSLAGEFGYRSTLCAPLLDPTHDAVSRCSAHLQPLYKGELRDQGVYPIHSIRIRLAVPFTVEIGLCFPNLSVRLDDGHAPAFP